MRLTLYTDYSLRVLIYLGIHNDRWCPVAEIAKTYGISQNHLMKVVQGLSRDKFIDSVRGPKGGIKLAQDPNNINVGNLVRSTEEELNLADCETCKIAPACLLAGIFAEGTQAMLNVFDKYTLADLMTRRKQLLKRLD